MDIQYSALANCATFTTFPILAHKLPTSITSIYHFPSYKLAKCYEHHFQLKLKVFLIEGGREGGREGGKEEGGEGGRGRRRGRGVLKLYLHLQAKC